MYSHLISKLKLIGVGEKALEVLESLSSYTSSFIDTKQENYGVALINREDCTYLKDRDAESSSIVAINEEDKLTDEYISINSNWYAEQVRNFYRNNIKHRLIAVGRSDLEYVVQFISKLKVNSVSYGDRLEAKIFRLSVNMSKNNKVELKCRDIIDVYLEEISSCINLAVLYYSDECHLAYGVVTPDYKYILNIYVTDTGVITDVQLDCTDEHNSSYGNLKELNIHMLVKETGEYIHRKIENCVVTYLYCKVVKGYKRFMMMYNVNGGELREELICSRKI